MKPACSPAEIGKMYRKTLVGSFGACALLIGLATFASPSAAGNASFSLPVQAANRIGTAVGTNTVTLISSGTGGFTISFVLPVDYVKNSKVAIVLYLTDPSVVCTVRFVPATLVRTRGGAGIASDLSGLSAKNGSALIEFAGDTDVVVKDFILKRGSALKGQRAGDGILVGFQREADDVTDKCNTSAFVHQIDVRYSTP
jgi:hypothetical protein